MSNSANKIAFLRGRLGREEYSREVYLLLLFFSNKVNMIILVYVKSAEVR